MIDNFKLYSKNKYGLESHIVENELVELSNFFNPSTGEIKEYPKRGRDYNLEISLNLKSSVIKGSLHKYHNVKCGKKDQNYDDFCYSDQEGEILGLLKKYDLEKTNYLTNLEFGLNLTVDKDPKIIIENNVLMNKCKEPNKNLKFSGKGDYKEFQVTDYIIKVYNKSKQFGLDDSILRVELKIIRRSYLKKLGIYQLEDLLDKEVLKVLYKEIKEKIEGLVIVDTFDDKNIPISHLERLNNFTNPHYWFRLKTLGKTSKQISRLKNRFNLLLNKYNLVETKKSILYQMDKKFLELLEC